MNVPASDDGDAFVAAFLQQRLADQRLGIDRALEDYLRRFPGHTDAIRAAWRDTTDTTDVADGDAAVDGSAPGDAPPIATIGPYQLLRRLGHGGQGDVWLAEDPRLGRRVAIKLLRGVAFANADGLERFRREARVASHLDHPGICPVYDAGFAGGMPYLVMRYVDGRPLAAAIASLTPRAGSTRQVQLQRVARLVARLARALHAAHEAGVLHRDVKPQNVMLTGDDEPVLLDFGLAHCNDDATLFTRTGDRLGTPAYLPPEQLTTRPERPERTTDVYGLGVVLFECLTGERPFEAPTLDSLYRQIADGTTPMADSRNAAVPRDLAVIAATAMHHERQRRYHTAAAFADDLERWLDRRPIVARPAGALVRAWSWARRRPALAASLLALTITLAAGFAVSLTLGHHATSMLSEWQRLADRRRLDELVQQADTELWPALPDKLPAMRAWLDRAEQIVGRLPAHREALARLQSEAPAADGDDERQWRLGQLTELVRGLTAFATADPRATTFASVMARRDRAEQVTRATLLAPAAAWTAAAERVARHAAYRGLTLVPQLGLVPLGADPSTGFEEFADPATGTTPTRDADGRLHCDDAAAVVFVLLPGGTFSMGAQAEDPGEPDYDPAANAYEQPVHEVELAAFLMSKYELTQAQWLAVLGTNPSESPIGRRAGRVTVTGRHPVEGISWTMASTFAFRCGCELPTEAQWEYACRAGTTTPWSTGDSVASLLTAANLADEGSREFMAEGWKYHEGVDDGFATHAPVGSFAANRFGLFDMHGNVQEWCRDALFPYDYPVLPGTGERRLAEGQNVSAEDLGRFRQVRGGNFSGLATSVRSARRLSLPNGTQQGSLGVRVARALTRG